MTRGTRLLLLLLAIATGMQAQTPYRTRPAVDALLAGSGAALYVLGRGATAQLTGLDSVEAAGLDYRTVNPVDRAATAVWNPALSRVSDVLRNGLVLAPLSLTASERIREDALPVAVMYGEALLLTRVTTKLTKAIVKRYRPFAFNPDVPAAVRIGNPDARRSFYSGHAAMSWMAAVFTARLFDASDIDPDAEKWVWGGALSTAGMVGMLRVVAGKHYPSDVVVGAAMGTAIALAVLALHERDGRNGSGDRSVSLGLRFAL